MSSDDARSAYSTLVGNLRSIQKWVRDHEELPEMRNNDEFMSVSVEIMNKSLYLLKVGVSLTDQKSAGRGVTRNRAIVLGHLVRLMKLYECFVMHACERRLEICMIFFRLILETAIKLEYLLGAKRASFRSFVLTSYRPEKEHLKDLKAKARKRPLIPIEHRMLRSVRKNLGRDRIRQRDLLANRSWDLDGKNFRALLQDIGHAEWGYSYGFGNGSHFVHGDWRDLTLFHLVRHGRWYEPNPDYATTDPRVTCATTTVCLRVLLLFVDWNRSDPDNFVRPIIQELTAVNEAFEAAHERYLQSCDR